MIKSTNLAIGILSWRAPKTLRNTLISYRDAGLLDYAAQVFIYFNEISDIDREIADEFGIQFYGSEKNLGIAGGYREMLKLVTHPNYLFLENDWRILLSNYGLVASQLSTGEDLLQDGTANVVRFRSRLNPGEPLWTKQFKGKELQRPEHLLDSIHWIDNPAVIFSSNIASPLPGWYIAGANNANWTNNPHMVKSDWAKSEILPQLGERDIELDLQKWWVTTNFKVAQGEGLFTHDRLMSIGGMEINLHDNECFSNHIRREKTFFEVEILDYIRANHGEQKTIIDVGANIGNHSLYFNKFINHKEIYCFEPEPENYKVLELNTKYTNINLYKLALSDKKQTLKMSINQNNRGSCKIDRRGELIVGAIDLDALNIENITLLKIDVEGYEPVVLEGCKKTIDKCHPLILIEDGRGHYGELLPGYTIEKHWPQNKTYLYRWVGKPYLLSIYSYTAGVAYYDRSLHFLGDSVEHIDVKLEKYPGHLYRWDLIPKELDRNRVFIFTDTGDVIFQKSMPGLSSEYIYISDEGQLFKENSFWRAVFRRNPQFCELENEAIYNVGTFACSGKIMDEWVKYVQERRSGLRNFCEQLIFNQWVREPENISRLRELPDLFTSLASNLMKGTTIDKNGVFYSQNGAPFSVVHYNGSMKELRNKVKNTYQL